MRIAVIGAGTMGRHHARILGTTEGVELVVVDRDEVKAKEIASAHGGAAKSNPDGLALDAAIVATPTESHFDIAYGLIQQGVHVLVEKPLSHSVESAELIVRAAENAGVVLAVGHVERFNAAVLALKELTKAPIMMSFERLSPYTPRILGSVVFDLMVHDLDLACWIAGSYPEMVKATGRAVISDTSDVASASLYFPGGCVATLQASRMTQDKVRRICVSEKERFLIADSVRQDVSIKREASVEYTDEASVLYRQASIIEVPYLDRTGEPLALQMRDFIDAIRRSEAPTVDGQAGLRAVRLAAEVEKSLSN